MSRPILLLKGKRFGMLVVTSNKYRRPKSRIGTLRPCICDCGKYTWVRADALKSGTTRSCGCWKWEFRKLPKTVAASNELFGSYKSSAKERGFSWRLSRKTFDLLVSDLCFYCHRPPKQIRRNRRGDDQFIHNGIDRLDNNVGYVKSNVVTCCSICNRAKHIMSLKDFRCWIRDLVNANK